MTPVAPNKVPRRQKREPVTPLLGTVAAVSFVIFAGCMGTAGDSSAGNPGGSSRATGTTGTAEGGAPVGNIGPLGPAPAPAVETSRLYRLSHSQWENTVRDILGLPAHPGLAQTFAKDAVDSFFSNDGEALSVSDQLRLDYEQAAETVGQRVVGDPATVARLIPNNAPSDPMGRARAFIGELGRRAYRRPLNTSEVDEYFALFQSAATISPMTDPFLAGVGLVTSAVLQSPYFLYRLELSTGSAPVHLDPYEIASKLSYALTDTIPDAALLSAAASGMLDANGVATEANRILNAIGAGPSIQFHAELYALDEYTQITKDPQLLPQFTTALGASMRQEANLFLGDVFQSGKGLTDLLTAPFTFVDANLAPLYGLPPPQGGAFSRVQLDPAQRAGFLTRLGFLTEFAGSMEPDIIHRGVFINERLLCVQLPPPAISVFPDPPTNLPTNRDRIEALTGAGTCAATCHERWMNPAGIAFEHYDVLGRYRTSDNGAMVDSSDSFQFTDGTRSYQDAIGFSRALSESLDSHHCYAKNWFAYLQARSVRPGEGPLIDWLARASAGGLSVKGLLLAVVTNDTFLTRLP
jgi:hypothetical protein